MGCDMTNLSSGFPKKWDSNQPAQLQRLARKMKLRLSQIQICYFTNKQRHWSVCAKRQAAFVVRKPWRQVFSGRASTSLCNEKLIHHAIPHNLISIHQNVWKCKLIEYEWQCMNTPVGGNYKHTDSYQNIIFRSPKTMYLNTKTMIIECRHSIIDCKMLFFQSKIYFWLSEVQFCLNKFCVSNYPLLSVINMTYFEHVWPISAQNNLPDNVVFILVLAEPTFLYPSLNTMWILISWFLQKPADQNPHCFQTSCKSILLKFYLMDLSFVCVHNLHLSQQCFSHVRTFSCLLGWTRTKKRIKWLSQGHNTES